MTPAEVFNLIDQKRRRPWEGEEEVRLAWVAALERGLNIHFDAERARLDSSYNNVIIEFKAPGLFGGSKSSAKFKEAMDDRLLKYIKKAAKAQGMHQEDFIGIAIDGEHLCFAQVSNGAISTQHLLPFSHQTVGLVMEACRNNYRRAITADNLVEDFGHTSTGAAALMQALSDALAKSLSSVEPSKIRMLFEEWRTLYGQVADLSREQVNGVERVLRFTWKGALKDSISARLFVIHSYNSLLIKLLAAEIVSSYGLSSKLDPAQEMSALLDDSALLERLTTDIEAGKLFSDAGIIGFVEEAIFSWYLDACSDAESRTGIIAGLRNVLGKLSLYRTARLDHARDVLRDFYQGLVPETLRKSLGEFYTPDWLVEYTVGETDQSDWLATRALDPTCGSGSFLIELIKRKRAAAIKKKMSSSATVEMLCSTVWGFDLNPLAVQTSRVNFLMEIADLLKANPGQQIEIPVLLADAIYSPARDPNADEPIVTYQIGSQVAGLSITLPAELAFDRARLDSVFESMGEQVERDQEYKAVEALLIAHGQMDAAEAQKWRKPLTKTYNQVLSLHRKTWNGIWFRIVRNFFWSATAGQFDVIVGNPPWVRWSKLPDAYRERVKPTCDKYDIFSKTPHHGGNELDISAMITYTTSDKWLKTNGRLVFVITQTVFQNPSSAGFRQFRITDTERLRPLKVHDLKALKPFADAANKTTVAVFEKSTQAPAFPVPYELWEARKGESRSISATLALADVLKKIKLTDMEAHQVDGDGSPWAILEPGRMATLKGLAGSSIWVEGRKGITTDLNGVYFVPVLQDNGNTASPLVEIQTRPDAGKSDIGAAKKVWIEPTMLYPLIKGASDFSACYLAPKDNLFALVPNSGIRKADYEASETALSTSVRKTKAFFNGFKARLETRSTLRGRMPGAPYYAMYNVGDFTFKPWKVIWAEMSGSFSAAVAGKGKVPMIGLRPYVPDHKIYFVALDHKATAHYLCGLLNAPMVAEFVESHNISIQVGDIFKHMQLPSYNAKDATHIALAADVEKAHTIDDKKKRADLLAKIRTNADGILSAWMKASKSKAKSK
jgi:hypothetical protein